MPHYVKTMTTRWSAERAFSYMADFSNAAEWDPGVVGAERVDTGKLGAGSVFDLEVKFAGRTRQMRYEITDYELFRVTFTSRSAGLESVDTVTVVEQDGHTEVTYDARLHFRRLARLADPLLALGFRGVAERATASLQRRLAHAP